MNVVKQAIYYALHDTQGFSEKHDKLAEDLYAELTKEWIIMRAADFQDELRTAYFNGRNDAYGGEE